MARRTPFLTTALTGALTGAALVLASCATGPDGEANARPQGFEDYENDPRLGERVDRICFGSQIDSFGETTSETVLLEAGVNDWYLVHTYRCSELDFAQSLRFDRFGSCLSRGDDIIAYDSAFGPDNTGPAPRNCPIRAIYEWDEDAVEEDAVAEDAAGTQG